MAIKIPFLKQSVALATASTPNVLERYRENPFFRSTVNIIVIQTTLVLVTIVVFGIAIAHQQQATSNTIESRRAAIRAGQVLTPESLDNRLADIRNDTLGSTLIVLIVLAGIFGFLSARFALEPTRNSLEYQKRFIGNVAHELRTPLAIIRTNTEVAMMDKTLSEYSRSTFAITLEELTRASEIMNNLLSFDSLLRPGRIKIGPVELTEVVRGVISQHRGLAETNGIALTFDGPDALHTCGNAVALGQVFTNLVKNALNYTPQHDGRSVTVRTREEDDKVSVSVVDTGIGIAQKDLYHVFEPFYRGDTSRTRGIGSGTSGLGLAIVNDIVRAHSGSIIIRSALNRGTTIEIVLPKLELSTSSEDSSPEDDAAEHEASIVA